MSDDERKPRLHIHTGGLIILIIILLILFKVDIGAKINNPQFQKNINYIEEQAKAIWQDYIVSPIKSKTGDLFIDFTNKSLEKIQTNFTENVLKTPNIENITN
jgi:hypothetical protein